MLKYRINTKNFNKTQIKLSIDKITFVDFDNLTDEEDQTIKYNGNKVGKLMVTCECKDIDKLQNGSFINTVNTIYLNYGDFGYPDVEDFTFQKKYQISGVNNENNSFSFFIDKYYNLSVKFIEKPNIIENTEDDNIFLYFNENHYFDYIDNIVNDKQEIPIYFNYYSSEGELVTKIINFRSVNNYTLVTSYDDFNGKEELFNMIFNKNYEGTVYGDLSNIAVYRDNFLFTDKTIYEFTFERPFIELNIPIVNTFETTLYQMELLNEHFIENEKKKAINKITDIEKDIYYPCIINQEDGVLNEVYRIKFNLHFREHRGSDWLVDNESFWNGVEQEFEYVNKDDGNVISEENYEELTEEDKSNYIKKIKQGTAKIVKVGKKDITDNNMSDLLSFLGFTNNDIHYQKNKLKKSFLRLSFYDSTNPANQNMIGYSTIFFNTGDLFSKYVNYFDDEGINYTAVNANKNKFGLYNPSSDKIGIRVDRESWDDKTRLSSQFVIKNKNLSKNSSEGFYLYIWKDNEMAKEQDLYMKVEFNHAGYGRTIPFMMPYWDANKWKDDTEKRGIKSLQEILDDWNSTAVDNLDQYNRVVWKTSDNKETDGHYGIKQYTKFSYIHLKYKYDIEKDKHVYYLDPDTYGNIEFPVGEDGNEEIVINLYEAKVE